MFHTLPISSYFEWTKLCSACQTLFSSANKTVTLPGGNIQAAIYLVLILARYLPRGRGSYIGRALRYVRGALFRGRAIRGRKRTLLILSDGASSDRVRGPALRLKREGVELFALGIGSRFSRSQLQMIASSPLNVFTAGFSRLGKVIQAIKEKVCRPRRPTPTREFITV